MVKEAVEVFRPAKSLLSTSESSRLMNLAFLCFENKIFLVGIMKSQVEFLAPFLSEAVEDS